jgi:ribonucleoside-diphosphate reductase alpha subunit
MINDIFMERVRDDGIWSLMCPSECPEILGKYGKEFTNAYEECENNGRYVKQIRARMLWQKIIESHFETGTPYMIAKAAANEKSNQKNIGVINCSNLCAEILEVSTPESYAVCNLASICLPKYIEYHDGVPTYNYELLCEVAKVVTRNLNKVIDINYYPVEKTIRSNVDNRPIGIGIQGLADVFAIYKTPFDSELARDMNKKIFETIYFGCMTASCDLAERYGYYASYPGSPISSGLFQFNLWNMQDSDLSGFWDWGALRKKILKYGVRNSLTTACMPTASTAQIMGNNECIEPYTSNLYLRSTVAGDFYVVNQYLVKDLRDLGLWCQGLCDIIKYYEGSIQMIHGIPDSIKEIYRTAWEIPCRSLIEMSADRAPFIDQTQSLNIFIADPNYSDLTSALFHGWSKGLKTMMYYLRTKPASEASKFGIDIDIINRIKQEENDNMLNVFNKIAQQVHKVHGDIKPSSVVRQEDGIVCTNCSA